jgi:hypothetical protein
MAKSRSCPIVSPAAPGVTHGILGHCGGKSIALCIRSASLADRDRRRDASHLLRSEATSARSHEQQAIDQFFVLQGERRQLMVLCLFLKRRGSAAPDRQAPCLHAGPPSSGHVTVPHTTAMVRAFEAPGIARVRFLNVTELKEKARPPSRDPASFSV